MKEIDCTLNMPVSLASKDKVRRGKVVGPTSQVKGKTVALVEWSDGKIEKVDVTSLISKEEGDEIASVLKAKDDAKKAETKRLMEIQEKLESEFEEAFNKVHPEIQEKIAQASALIGEAVSLSEKYGIPCRPEHSISGANMSYIPSTLRKKWAKLYEEDSYSEFVNDLTGAYGGEYDGWQSSQVC